MKPLDTSALLLFHMLLEGSDSTATNLNILPDGQIYLKDLLACRMEALIQFFSLHYGLFVFRHQKTQLLFCQCCCLGALHKISSLMFQPCCIKICYCSSPEYYVQYLCREWRYVSAVMGVYYISTRRVLLPVSKLAHNYL